ncbi:PP-loop domain protein [Magnetococcus marinus MC-1]|uniref:PP-loop domain protein n=2 Tax=Magnetococcus TaxID=162171 RepID=A0LAD2_MAGMM|nr:PP-loop domain protein [Magnetococcus marinus MC-1]
MQELFMIESNVMLPIRGQNIFTPLRVNYPQGVPIRTCSRCIMNTTDAVSITLDDEGVCSECRNFDQKYQKILSQRHENSLELHVGQIKALGEGRPYDTILGVSGGVDSTYLALLCKRYGIRPLLVHCDNGWNSELAVDNINRMLEITGFDLHTHVIDWDTFRHMQRAYLWASVVDIEVLSDHAIFSVMYDTAKKYNVPTVISGVNVETEGFLPYSWIYLKDDVANIKDICAQYCKVPIDRYPMIKEKDLDALRKSNSKRLKRFDLLNDLPCRVEEIKNEISKTFGWRDYGGKHFESIFTRFFQGYILPVKFGIHKRKAHLSNLICSGQISRQEAICRLEQLDYSPELCWEDYEFVIKKLGLSREEFSRIMLSPPRKHSQFWSNKSVFYRYTMLRPFYGFWRNFKNSRGGLSG